MGSGPDSPQLTLHATARRGRGSASVAWWLMGGFVIVCLAYANSFRVPLMLDDWGTIARNPSIVRLWPLGPVLVPPEEVGAAGRPFLNLTFAINHALGGVNVAGYHVVNLLVHLAAAGLLFGVMARTLSLPRLGRSQRDASWIAATAAVLWALHPVNTEAVTYLSQRAESLMGLCYLGTFYCFLRAVTSGRAGAWQAAAVFVCTFGMVTKEGMVTAPLLLLMFDRTFVAATWSELWLRRKRFYAWLALTWIPLAVVMTASHVAGRVVGAQHAFTPWTYLVTESGAVWHYVRLAIWPVGLVFDYGPGHGHPADLIDGLRLGGLAVAFGWLVVRWWHGSALAWCGLAWFVLLAPTSSVVPIASSPIAESRMYLPLILVLAVLVIGCQRVAGTRAWIACGALAVAFGTLCMLRNGDYRSELSIWTDTVAKRPENPRAHNNLGFVLSQERGRAAEAVAEFTRALALQPDYPEAHNNLGIVLARDPRTWPEAEAHFRAALALRPNYGEAQLNYANLLAQRPGREAEAVRWYEAALETSPDAPTVHSNFGVLLARIPGREQDALAQYETALRLDPDYAEAHSNLGLLLSRSPATAQLAIAELRRAIELNPDLADAHNVLGTVLARQRGQVESAIAEFNRALQLNPADVNAHYNLGLVLERIPGRSAEAEQHFETAMRLRPNFQPARAAMEAFQRR